MRVGAARVDITPREPVWLTGYANRDHRSEGSYAPLFAGALYLEGDGDRALVITADVIGFSPPCDAEARQAVCDATGLLPRQVVLTATHTHCAPFLSPWNMPGEVEAGYADWLIGRLQGAAVTAAGAAVEGRVEFSRGRSTFGVNRRLPDGHGGVSFAPNPDGPIDRDLDTLWFRGAGGDLLASLTVYGCHPTSIGGYLVGPDYPGFLCRHLGARTGAPALFATGCAGDVRPWFGAGDHDGFARPTLEELEEAGAGMAAEVLETLPAAEAVAADGLCVDHLHHRLPYAGLPSMEQLEEAAGSGDDHWRRWGEMMLPRARAGGLADACVHEIQMLQLNPDFRVVFLGGEVLSEIGLHIKKALAPATTVTVAYANGLIAYVPSAAAVPLGGYEVDGSFHYFQRPAPFTADCERLLVEGTASLAARLS